VDGGGASQRATPSTEAAALALSPDGSRVAFLHSVPSQAFGATPPAEIWLAGVTGDQPEHLDLLPPSEERFDDLTWGPGAQHLLVIGHVLQPTGGQSSHLLWVDVTTGQSRELITLSRAIVPGSDRWSPDGQKVAFLAQTDQLTSLCLIEVRDGDFHYLGDLGRDVAPAFPFAPVAWSSDAQHLLYIDLPPAQTASAGWPITTAPASQLVVADTAQPTGHTLGSAGLVPLTWDLAGPSPAALVLAQPTHNCPLVLRRVALDGTTSDLLELSLRPSNPFVARWDAARRQALIAARHTSGIGGSGWDYWPGTLRARRVSVMVLRSASRSCLSC
jgi:dipeptidyl aminopeptidase/acylaminoacyl peptidase